MSLLQQWVTCLTMVLIVLDRRRASATVLIVLIMIAVVVLAGSLWADYRWRKWMAERRRDRE